MIISAMLASLLKAIMLTFYTAPPPALLTPLSAYCINHTYTVKKFLRISRPRPGCHLSNTPRWPGTIKLFPATESLVSDILAGDWKTAKPFFTVYLTPPRRPIYLVNSPSFRSPALYFTSFLFPSFSSLLNSLNPHYVFPHFTLLILSSLILFEKN